MALLKPPTINNAGRDADNNRLLAALEEGTDNVATLEIAPGSAPGRGILKVQSSASPPAGPAGAGTALVGAVATQLPSLAASNVLLINDDGAEPNGNTETIWIGTDATVAPGSGFPLRVGAGISLDVTNLDNLWAICASGGQTLSYVAEG